MTTNNPHQIAGLEYPKQMYRKATEEARQVQTTKDDGSPKSWIVTNSFHGHLCDTITALTPHEAELLAAEGWAATPAAAHGNEAPMSAKDAAQEDVIAGLKAQIAALQAAEPRRGPGRPARVPETITE